MQLLNYTTEQVSTELKEYLSLHQTEYFNAINDIFHASVDGKAEKGYHVIGNYFGLVYEAGFAFSQVTTEEITALVRVETKDDFSTNPKFGQIIGIDIGKSDIKGVASRGGVVVASDRF